MFVRVVSTIQWHKLTAHLKSTIFSFCNNRYWKTLFVYSKYFNVKPIVHNCYLQVPFMSSNTNNFFTSFYMLWSYFELVLSAPPIQWLQSTSKWYNLYVSGISHSMIGSKVYSIYCGWIIFGSCLSFDMIVFVRYTEMVFTLASLLLNII